MNRVAATKSEAPSALTPEASDQLKRAKVRKIAMNSNSNAALNQVTQESPPVIAGVGIHTDKHGRFSLNAIHRASGAGKAKTPGYWTRTQQAKELIQEVKNQDTDLCLASNDQGRDPGFAPIESYHGGNNPGTFAHELLAVSYAGWISPKFQLQVNQTFLDYRTGKLQRQAEEQKALPSPLTPSHQRKIQKAIASRVYMLPETVRPAAFKRVYSKLKDRFDVGTYKDIDDTRYLEALDAIESFALEGELLPNDEPAPIRPVKRLKYSEADLLATGLVEADGRFKRWANCGPANDPLRGLLSELSDAAYDGRAVIIEDVAGAVGMYNAMASMIANDTELMMGLENHVSKIRDASRARLRTIL